MGLDSLPGEEAAEGEFVPVWGPQSRAEPAVSVGALGAVAVVGWVVVGPPLEQAVALVGPAAEGGRSLVLVARELAPNWGEPAVG